jgi:prenyltransferase beta subunit
MFRIRACILGVLVVMPLNTRAQTADEKKATVAYLHSLQVEGKLGGFLARPPEAGRKDVPTLRSTSAAIRALNYFGGTLDDYQDNAARLFVASCHDLDKSGGFRPSLDEKARPDVYNTAVGLMAVVELKKMPRRVYEDDAVKFLGKNAKNFEEIRIAVAGLEAVGKLPPEAKDWIKQIEKIKNEDGTFGKDDGAARDTGGAVVALLRMGVKPDKPENVLKVMRAGQRKDGGFGQAGSDTSDLETTYRVMRAFHMLKAKPAEPEKVRAFIAKCRAADGGYGVAPGQPSNVGGTYFAGTILHWLEEK